jgi:hypothetical protein
MKLGIPFLVGVALAIGLLSLLWGSVAWQFGTLKHGFRYLTGYNYAVYPSEIDVGEGTEGDQKTSSVMVRNLSFSPIRVIGALTTCKCLVVTGLPLTIEPRQTVDVQFTIRLESSKGGVEQIATILIDDGQMQQSPVAIRGRCTSSH